MQNKNLIDVLHFDLVQQVSSFLDYKSIASASKVSKTWKGFFNNNLIWKNRLIKDFDIDTQVLATTFQNEIKNNTLNYKQLYVHFHSLSQQRNLPKFIESIYCDIKQNHLVLLACADNVDYLKTMQRDQQYTVAVLSMYAGSFKIAYLFIEKNKDKSLLKNLLHHAIRSGNLQLGRYLLSPDNRFGLKPYKDALNAAAESGNLQLVQYLLDAENKFGLQPDTDTLNSAAYSGNFQLVEYLMNAKNKFGLNPFQSTLDRAAYSGNLQLVQYLMNSENKFDLNPYSGTLNCATFSGNLQLVQYLLKFVLKADDNTLDAAAESGNLQLLQYLLQPENNFWLKPKKYTLSFAAQSGNLQLVQYLLNPENKFSLELTQRATEWAAESGNLQLVQYLVDQCDFTPDYDTLNSAVKSGNLQLVQYLLNEFNLMPDNQTLNSAVKAGNLQLVQYLLNPDKDLHLEVSQKVLDSATNTTNFALSEYLLPCHMAIQQALVALQTNNITETETLLDKSHTACPNHYKVMLHYIVNNSQRFNLHESAMQCLKKHADVLIEDEKMRPTAPYCGRRPSPLGT